MEFLQAVIAGLIGAGIGYALTTLSLRLFGPVVTIILICSAVLGIVYTGDAHAADTVTASFPATLITNQAYSLTIIGIATIVIMFFGLLWWAAGADRPKIKADLLHTPPKEPENPPVKPIDWSVAGGPKPGEFYTFGAAHDSAKLREPTWEIKEVYDRGEVRWVISKFTYQVRSTRHEPLYWKVVREKFVWGEAGGYKSKIAAQEALAAIMKSEAEVTKEREVIQYNRRGNPIDKDGKLLVWDELGGCLSSEWEP